MVITSQEKGFEMRSNMKGGDGSIQMEAFAKTSSLPTHYRIFSEMTIRPGCSIGRHTHEGESEIYYVLEGEAVLDDNGKDVNIKTGDAGICFDGEFHGVKNNSDKIVRILAIIVTNA